MAAFTCIRWLPSLSHKARRWTRCCTAVWSATKLAKKHLSRGESAAVAGPFAWQRVVSLVDKSSGLDLDFRYERTVPGGWDRISRLLALPPEFRTDDL